MADICLKPKVKKFIQSLPSKHQRQVKDYILALGKNPRPHDVKQLVGYAPYLRSDIGEYRVIYSYDNSDDLITIVLVGKRNDSQIYRVAKRILK